MSNILKNILAEHLGLPTMNYAPDGSCQLTYNEEDVVSNQAEIPHLDLPTMNFGPDTKEGRKEIQNNVECLDLPSWD